ncbi:hypothetical protein LEP1GSC188_4281 [Leptospira weilii serovar Topaz str. LT2116]|uniref:Uncharacterized protein n=1 Tax=Leptospira weilii serovar Topaz str. LT2116 TaxID=1088540 RepID=M3H413_9LEPT|nr:hypothetical protein LEP1GSC188_4281 [Leptospira weilii serovar Topaz str. LT2116]
MQKLNQFFIYTDLDFRDEFRKDLIPVEKLRILINSAFEDVVRGNDTTLHEAVAEDDYLSEEEVLAARKKDTTLLARCAVGASCKSSGFLGLSRFRRASLLFTCNHDLCAEFQLSQRLERYPESLIGYF